LNEGGLGATQVGKFVTIFPDTDRDARELARRLVDATTGLRGPVVRTDLRLGDVVYARYGGFNPVVGRDRLGQTFLLIHGADGALRPDHYSVPFNPPSDVENPFRAFPTRITVRNNSPIPDGAEDGALLGPGYLVLDVLKAHAKGSVFHAIDLRTQRSTSLKVIKQGRQHCLSDAYGRDMRVRLQRQAALHETLHDLPCIVGADPYFEVDGDGYLSLQSIDGRTLESVATEVLAGRPWRRLDPGQQLFLLTLLENVLGAVSSLHSRAHVHRDLTASNILVTDGGRVYLLDLELTHHVDDPEPAFGLGTPGFMSPQQENRQRPAFADDIFALGCCSLLTLTGVDPRRLLFASGRDRVSTLLRLTGGAARGLVETAARSVRREPHERPALDELQGAVHDAVRVAKQQGGPSSVRNLERLAIESRIEIRRVAEGGLRGILEDVACDGDSGLWLSASFQAGHAWDTDAPATYEVRRGASRGVAGVVFALSRMARVGLSADRSTERVARAVEWLLSANEGVEREMPGLHFGEAGVAVALAEAASAGFVDMTTSVRQAIGSSLVGSLDWPDVTHGAAGQGIAALYCQDRAGDPTFGAAAHRCAEYLLREQRSDGSWTMPPGVEGMSGETLTGFAHGVAGVVYFLAEYSSRTGNLDADRADRAWRAGAEWLAAQAVEAPDGSLSWRYSDRNSATWKWWCHGAPGIALAFLRIYELTRERRFNELATNALRSHGDVFHANLSQCHGLSGLGEVYLEAARVTGDRCWSDRAASVAGTLVRLRRESSSGGVTWLVDQPYRPTADLMVGTSGVVHFLMRVQQNDRSMGPPLLLDPAIGTRRLASEGDAEASIR
jgi:hypothetical protein